MNVHNVRRALRRRGADLTQAMLYAAFAIIVLISVFGLYRMVSLNHHKAEIRRMMVNASEGGRFLMSRGLQVNAGTLRDSGYLPTSTSTTLPILGGGDVAFNTYANGPHFLNPVNGPSFDANMRFNDDDGISRMELALCKYFSQGEPGVIIEHGRMGNNYILAEVQCDERVWFRAYYLPTG